ncbi:MAG: NifU family protein [Pseudobdellovibrionaceae bacterium]
MSDIQVSIEQTPNPATLKFTLSHIVSEQGYDFANAQDAHFSPLASKLFGFPWTNGVYIGPDFITVTKQDWVDWDVLAEPLASLIREHLQNGEPVFTERPKDGQNDEQESDSEIVKQIKRILNAEIRPVVAMDGGDIVFANYSEGTLALHMKGACAGCPSSTATLKEGIEARMKELLPEIKEVISI